MNDILGLGLLGWLVALAVGFVVGGLFFMSIKLQVEYVLNHKGPLWLVPAAMYARLVLAAALLIVAAVTLPSEKVAPAAIAATAGTILARVLIGRKVRKEGQ